MNQRSTSRLHFSSRIHGLGRIHGLESHGGDQTETERGKSRGKGEERNGSKRMNRLLEVGKDGAATDSTASGAYE